MGGNDNNRNDNNNNNSEVVRHNIRPVLSNILTLQQPIENAIETSNAAAIVNKQHNMYFHEVFLYCEQNFTWFKETV